MRANELATRVIPTDLLRGIRVAQNAVQWETIETNEKGSQRMYESNRNIWAGAAASVNYMSASHIDDDFFLSCLTVLCHEDGDVTVHSSSGNRSAYRKNVPIAL